MRIVKGVMLVTAILICIGLAMWDFIDHETLQANPFLYATLFTAALILGVGGMLIDMGVIRNDN